MGFSGHNNCIQMAAKIPSYMYLEVENKSSDNMSNIRILVSVKNYFIVDISCHVYSTSIRVGDLVAKKRTKIKFYISV